MTRCALRLLALAGWVGTLCLAQTTGQLEQWNQSLESAAPQDLRPILTVRARQLIELMDSEPAQALRLLLPARTAERLRGVDPSLAAFVETAGEWDGAVEVAVADNFKARSSRTVVKVHATDGTLQVHFVDGPPAIGCGDTIQVRGFRVGNHVLASAAHLTPALSTSSCSVTTGPQQIVAILVNMPSAHLPAAVTPAFVSQYLFGSSGNSLSRYWNEASYGKTTATGTVVGPFTLSQNFVCDQSDNLMAAAIAAADSSVNLSNYNRVFVIFPQVATCSWAGLGSVGCSTLSSPSRGSFPSAYSLFVAEDLNSNDAGVATSAHEGGHNLSLNHSNTLQFGNVPLGAPGDAGTEIEYNDYSSVMGYGYTYGTTTFLGHYSAPHKSALGWFSGGNLQFVSTPGTYFVQPYESPTAGVQALRVQRGSGIPQYLWIEYRQPLGTDATFQVQTSGPYQGAWIHFDDPGNLAWSGFTHLLDFTAATTPDDFTDAALAAGSSWSDPYSLLSLTVNSATASGLSVAVNYDTPCATLSAVSATHSSAAASGTIQVTGACASTATSNAPWITVTGGNILNGTGTVSYSVTANTTAYPRAGTISIARQIFTITQGVTGRPTVLALVPSARSSQAGQPQSVAFSYSDQAGASALTKVIAAIGVQGQRSSSCWIQYVPATSTLQLFSNDGVALTITPMGSGSLANSQCTVNSAASQGVANGTTLTLLLTITLNASYAGAQAVWGEALEGGNDSGLARIGTWTVTSASPSLSISETHNGTFFAGQIGAVYLATITNQASNPTAGSVTFTETAPSGMTLASLSGANWNCSGSSCTRSDALAPQGSYPPIRVTMNIAANAPAVTTNGIAVSGGGLASSAWNDVTPISPTLTVPSTLFVQQLYRDLLAREADAAGLSYWKSQIDSGALTRTQLAAQFFTGPEFTASGYYLIKLYLAVLARDPDYAGWSYWFNRVQTGLPTANLLATFLGSAEFVQRYGNQSNATFVALVYQNVLGRAPDAAGLQYYVGLLNNNQLSQAAVFDSFVRSPEYDQTIRSRAYSNLLYMGFLRRSAEPGGLQYWSNSLTNGTPLAAVVGAFTGSVEYLSRLAPLVPAQ